MTGKIGFVGNLALTISVERKGDETFGMGTMEVLWDEEHGRVNSLIHESG
jgi:hypothetical protein